MKKREKIEDLLKLVENLPLRPYEAPGVMEKVEDLLNLIEGLPLHDYAAPEAVQEVAKFFAEDDNAMSKAAEVVRLGIGIPGVRHYNYGRGILLRKWDRDSLIKCLRHILYGKRGAPKKDDDDKLDKAFADRRAFEQVLTKLESAGIKAPKTRAYEIFETKWNLTNRQVRNRISSAFKLAPF
jgi:hypothetical protein